MWARDGMAQKADERAGAGACSREVIALNGTRECFPFLSLNARSRASLQASSCFTTVLGMRTPRIKRHTTHKDDLIIAEKYLWLGQLGVVSTILKCIVTGRA